MTFNQVTFNLADLFETVADAVPEREAIVCGDRRLSYADLDHRINRLAHALAAQGIGPGDHIGLHLYNGSEYLEGMLAAFKLRAVPINVNYRYVAHELRYLLGDADCKAVICEEDFTGLLHELQPDLPLLTTVLPRGSEYESALAAASDERDFAPRSPDDRYILYTGGTTGMPKGVVWRQEDAFFGAMGGGNLGGPPISEPEELATKATRVAAGLTRCLPACPFMHGTAHWLAFNTLYTAGTLVVFPGRHLDPPAVAELAADEAVNVLVIVGDAFARPFAEVLDETPRLAKGLKGLAVLLSGGAILSPSVKDRLAAVLPNTLVLDGYGASETGAQGQMVAGAGATSAKPTFRVNNETMVVDDNLDPVVPGSGLVGRLARRGHVPLGYHKDETKTAATFPVVNGVRWAVPGDYATVDADGTITLLGRGSVSINTGGEKVYPEEVEAILKGHTAVFDAVVVGVTDERWGERVVAVISLRDGSAAPSLDELQTQCRDLLAGYKVPRDVVVVDEIVRSPSGKPDYKWARTEAARALGQP